MSDREELLRAVALGELSADSPEVDAARRSDPELDAEVEALVGLVDGLDRAGSAAAASIDEARAEAGAPGEAAVTDLVRRRVAARGASGGGGMRLLAVAATVLLVVLVWWAPHEPSSPPHVPDIPLGSEHLHDLRATSDLDGFTELTWESDLRGGWYEVRVFDTEGHEIAFAEVRGTSWRPTAADVPEWPVTIDCEVRWIDGAATPSSEVASARATRVP